MNAREKIHHVFHKKTHNTTNKTKTQTKKTQVIYLYYCPPAAFWLANFSKLLRDPRVKYKMKNKVQRV